MNVPHQHKELSVPSDTSEITALQTALQQYWGYRDFRPLQREAMSLVMKDMDSLVVLPTGGGKSLCYQVPAVSRDGLALIVSPLISLMKDQVDSLNSVGVPAACINSMQSQNEKMQVAGQIRRRELKLLYIAPERLAQEKTIQFLQDANVSFVAIDEAHCISQWGHDFRPEYRQLAKLRSAFPGAGIHGYTATATPQVRNDICEQLGLLNPAVLVGSFDRPNLQYRVERRYDAMGQIQRVLKRHRNESGVIYCISRKNVEATSSALNDLGFRTLPYHAGLPDEKRRLAQDSFIDESIQIIVATVAFGMGIDKSNVRFVIHAEMPRSLENYQQESGRAGRDGLEAECTLLYAANDVDTWEFLMQDIQDAAVRDTGTAALKAMQHYCISTRCRHQQLVRHFGQDLDSANCGACDICLHEMRPVENPLITGQKILSCVYRQGQRFGGAYTAQVLKGSRAKRIVENGHDQLSTWGLMKDESEPQIRNWIDQLLSQGFLRQAGEYNCLEITPTGRQLLKGELTPSLLKMRDDIPTRATQDMWEGVNRNLFDELRGLRTRLAVQKQVPPYIIFSDATLRDLAKARPTDLAGLTQIYGIGKQKRDEFGAVVLFTIRNWCDQNGIATDIATDDGPSTPTPMQTHGRKKAETPASEAYFDLFEQGLTVEEVCLQKDRSQGTVWQYLEQYVRTHHIADITTWIPETRCKEIETAIAHVGSDRLKPLFEHLKGQVSYEEIRVVRAAWDVRDAAKE
ncbi:MAG: DNA helicase RecQ [Planctomycetaceae bacterium]|nr:DNA helicase RecQ [Planctomycetaceae bacterium]